MFNNQPLPAHLQKNVYWKMKAKRKPKFLLLKLHVLEVKTIKQ